MSKLNQIQDALLELSGGAFQKLADTYLFKKGYENINPLGSVVGANKVRTGTPDTLSQLSNGKFVFVEHTTEQRNLYKKLESDLSKCFGEAKTGVSTSMIEEVVFCYTAPLAPANQAALTEKCQSKGVNVNFFNLGRLAFDLYQNYPGVARDFLGVQVDTGQIVGPDEFVSAYNKSTLATPLDTDFYFRDEELQQVSDALVHSSIVIISGTAGVGKSRLALEACRKFVERHSSYDVRCIYNRGADLFEDLRVHFSDSGEYLIFVDDANRVSGFDHVLQLLHDQRTDQKFKVVVTVRDYALEKAREVTKRYGERTEVELGPFEDKQVKQLLEDEFGIANPLYLDRIINIAQGNPRLAVMAAQVAKRENTLQSILDVSALYDEYFSSIRQDLEDLGNRDLLKVAGIVGFFRYVDRANAEQMNSIVAAFGISPEALWRAAQRLHELEVMDMYETEVLRFSDQVLATYITYLAFFKERTLDFSALLTHFFPEQERRLIDMINPILNAFGGEAIVKVMRPHVDEAWAVFEEANDQESLLCLMNTFWFMKETETLLFAQAYIERLETEDVDLSNLEFKPDSSIPRPSVLGVLGAFMYSSPDNFCIALNLLFDYLEKQPGRLPKVLHILTEEFGFKHTSFSSGFSMQRVVVDELRQRIRGNNELFSRLFIALADKYLHISFETTKFDGNVINIIRFELPATPELFELRQQLWGQIFRLYDDPRFQDRVLSAVYTYSTDGYRINTKEIIEVDAVSVLPFLSESLEPERYIHCVIAHKFLDLLERHQISFDLDLREHFSSETYTLSRLFLHDTFSRRELELDFHEFEAYKRERIKAHFEPFNFDNFKRFFEQALEIQGNLAGINSHQLMTGVENVFEDLAERDSELSSAVLGHYLQLGDPLRLNWILRVVLRLIQSLGAEDALALLKEFDYPTKRRWLFGFYMGLTPEQINERRLEELYALYREAEAQDMFDRLDYLLKYREVDKRVIPKAVEIISAKIELGSASTSALMQVVNNHLGTDESLVSIFEDDIGILKRAYLSVCKARQHDDYKSVVFSQILDVDPNFILEYTDKMYEGETYISRYDNQRNFSFLWLRDDYERLMTEVVERLYSRERTRFAFDTYLQSFFILEAENKDQDAIRERQDHLLGGLIERRYADVDFMSYLFHMIRDFSDERRRTFLALFLQHNSSFEDFKRLPLGPNHWNSLGSLVPTLQSHVDSLRSLLPLLNTVQFLEHRQRVEQDIQRFYRWIEKEKREDFMED